MTDNIETCSCTVIHEDMVSKVKESLPEEETLYDLGKTVSDAAIMCRDGESEKVNIITSQ